METQDSHPAENPSDSQRLKALVVDDERDNLELLQRAMRKDYEVYSALSGEDALKLFADHDFSIILSDQRMPGMSGTEFLQETIKRQPGTIRILITGYSDIDSVVDAINRGAVHRYVKKPWRKDELLQEISMAIQMQHLVLENQDMFRMLKEANEKLKEHEQLLLKDLDERTKQLYTLNGELRLLNEKLRGQSLRDGLTDLYNHRAFQQYLREELGRVQRINKPLTVLFLDVDHFKTYNDTHGHAAGDEVLRTVAEILASTSRGGQGSSLRHSDVIARYGGEEFAFILPETPLEGGLIKGERIRKIISDHVFPGMETQPLKRVSVSVGVSSFPEDATTAEKLIESADQAMYCAKEKGRNQVRAFRDLSQSPECLRS